MVKTYYEHINYFSAFSVKVLDIISNIFKIAYSGLILIAFTSICRLSLKYILGLLLFIILFYQLRMVNKYTIY